MNKQSTISKTAIATAIGMSFSMPAVVGAHGLVGRTVAPDAVAPLGSPIAVASSATAYYYDRAAVVARNAAGNVAVVWGTLIPDGSGVGLTLREFDAQGNPLTPEASISNAVDESLGGISPIVSLAMDDAGDFVAAWMRQDGSGFHVYAQKFSSAGTAVGGRIDVADSSDGSGEVSVPSVAMDPDGDFVVAWNRDTLSFVENGCYPYDPICRTTDTFQYTTYVRVYNSDASPRTDALMAYQSPSTSISYHGPYTPPPAGHSRPSLAMDASGNFVAAFDVALKTSEQIHAVRYNADGTGQQDILVKSYFVLGLNGYSGTQVAMDAAGNFDVLWGQYSGFSNPRPLKFYVKRYAANGSAKGSVVQDTPSVSAISPQIFMTAADDFCVSWRVRGSQVDQAFAQYHYANGGKSGSTVQLLSGANPPPNVDSYRGAAMDASGELAALFVSTYVDNSVVTRMTVNAQLFSAP